MKLPLKWGLLALVGFWVLHGALDDPRERTLVLVAAMGVALWTAFSLKIPPKPEPEEESLLEPPDDDEDYADEEHSPEDEHGAAEDGRKRDG